MLLEYNPRACLPSAKDLPHSDDTPVDNELQDLIPGLLKAMLALIWSQRMDWFFGVDMGVYYNAEEPAIVPDGFLSVGVPRIIDSDLRLSYLIWEEQQVPTLVLEVVSQTRRGEYTKKKEKYAQMGILYYVVYNPLRKKQQKLEVYQLEGDEYQLLPGELVWLPKLNLGIGRAEGTYQGITREWLYWYDENRERYLTPEERAQRAQLRANTAELERDRQRQEKELERQRAQSAELERDRQRQEKELERQEKERQQERADRAESDLQQLRDRLQQLNIDPDSLL